MNRRAHPDGGFTLVELLIVVVIMGLIIAVICSTIVMGVRLGPKTARRADIAAKASLLTNALSDDLANSTAVTASSPSSQTCTGTTTLTLATITLPGPVSAVYTASLAVESGATRRVVLSRKLGGGTPEPGLVGYCVAADTFVTAYSSTTGTLTFDLMVAPAVGDPALQIRVGGARRMP